ncbi:protein kinase domain-containing protein, partial [Paenibacillus taichungensis]|uniref:protein kinase domain-containing protein n=1 Tax=Paenibacillus taichungensis TaxID=484184 RepID=UPI0039E9806B
MIDRNFAFGGNGNLYLVKDENEIKYVLKILKIHSAKDVKKVKRFLNEIKFVEEYQDEIQGIIPIRFTYIPEELKSEFEFTADLKGTELWYVMDLAEPIAEKLGETRDLEMIIESLISLSQTLAELHSHIIVHRDIKPSNLYYYKDTWAFGDFGLVAYPEIDDKNLTGKDERIGNYATIAPEMRRGGLVEDARPADVWSLAKTLWMLITYNDSSCFEGSYSRNVEEISVSRYLKGVPTDLLHNILECASRYEPKNRVDIKEFLRMLEGYRDLLSDKKRIFSYKELQVLSHQSEEGRFFHNSADRTVATDQLIKNFNLILENQEYYFRTQQLDDEVDILKYI